VSDLRAGVGCGAAIRADGRILLVKRRRPPEAGFWNLPGGKVDFLERVEDAVCREILEETSLEVRLVRTLQLTQMLGQDGQHWVSPVWPAEVVAGAARNVEAEKTEAVDWFFLERPPDGQAAREAISKLTGTGFAETERCVLRELDWRHALSNESAADRGSQCRTAEIGLSTTLE
jgi:8-oxo-dGTP diphosphatase